MITNQIENIFKKYADRENFSGVGYVKKGETTVFHRAYGFAHQGWQVPNQLDTKFDTASITKIFTSVAIFKLIDEQLLSLEDRVLSILDLGESAISKDVSIYHLLTHTSGIADDADEEAGESYEELWKLIPNYSVTETVDYLPQFIHKESNFKPGEGCRYNNCAFILLGLIIEKISGMSYREYVKKHIFDVVGMKHTGFYSMDQVVEHAAEHYASILDDNENIIWYRKNIYSYPSIGSADAGALTTVTDLDLFLRSLKAGKLLSDELTNEIFTPKESYRIHEKVTEVMGYGFQFLIKNDTEEIKYIQKDGINPGVCSIMNYYPKTNTTIIILANQDTNVWDLAWEVQELLGE
ncbi:serine hydrolase domain-containing protein [Ferdinandcohnia quinoae]|uniref:Beta-lactamase family protein n=1 Tax=Fredinandcohnia quinoae TaxID=2918902 RepID=A0AAW5E6W3_9BACI|nr:serine hydrolase domain-containing protein [Fredinandcohnia sp. SECRCQ15]MCH1625731.1 beta-lactamase family protein [Fredinandcohnia sp. SECRCQ15]